MPRPRASGWFVLLSLCIASPSFAFLSVIRQGAESAETPSDFDHFGATVCTGDFNGDGLDDLATAAPDESNSLQNNAVHGVVVINYGTSRGLGYTGADVISVGDLGTASARFGRSLASADFDQDGYDDLAVGIPYLDTFGASNIGAVWVYRGSASGLELAPYRQIPYTLVETLLPRGGELFGWALTTGDFNDDDVPDLAASAIGRDDDSGVIYFFYGSVGTGIVVPGFDRLFPYTAGGSEATGSQFGWALASGQLDAAGGDDLVVGAPFTDVAGLNDTGRVYFYYAGSSGISGTDAWYLDASNIGTFAPVGPAQLGYSVATGHFGSVSDPVGVAVGAPQDGFSGSVGAGSVLVVAVNAESRSLGFVRRLYQNAAYNSGPSEPGDQFGYSLAVGRFDVGNYEDLAVGVPYEDLTEEPAIGERANTGMFHIFPGGPTGLSSSDVITRDMVDLNNFMESNQRLGTALAFGRFDGTSREGLAVGAPYADYDGYGSGSEFIDSGEVHIFAPWRQPRGYPHRSSTAFDCDGFLVYAQRPFQRVKPASTTKAVTLALACDAIAAGEVDPYQFYTVPAWVADGVGGSQTPLVTGEQLTFLGLMQTMMTVSGNDSAFLIGSILSGDGGPWEGAVDTDPTFAAMMEAKLSDLGLSSATSMTNAAGLDPGDHYVTALDWGRMAWEVIQDDCVRTLVDTSPWIVERIQPPGTSLSFFAVPGDGGGDITMYEAFDNGFVNSIKAGYSKTIGIKGGSTPGAGITGVAAADPFGAGTCAAAALGCRLKDTPVEGVPAGDIWGLNAALLKVAATFCDDGEPDDILVPPTDPGAVPWGLLTGIPACPEAGPRGFSFKLTDPVLVQPGGSIQFDLMRHTLVDPGIAVRQMISRTSEVVLGAFEQLEYGVAPHDRNEGLRIRNVGESTTTLEIIWGGDADFVELGPGIEAEIAGMDAPGSSFTGTIISLSGVPCTLEVTELGYQYELALGDGISAPDFHSVQLTRSGDVLSESVSAYVRGLEEICGDDTLDLVARADGGVTTAVGDPGGILPPVPASFRLLPPSPNPFNPRTTLSFDLPRPATVDLVIYDVRGQRVKTLRGSAAYDAGRHDVEWDGRDDAGRRVASGVYFVHLGSGAEREVRRMTLIK